MTRLNLILYFVLIFTALGVVTSQDRSRKLYFELEQQEESAKKMNVEFGQLQLEQSTWSMHSRVEDIAASKLQMQVPDAARIQVVSPDVPVDLPKAQAEKTADEPVVPDAKALVTSAQNISAKNTSTSEAEK
ncbi:MAG: cell division protein FtsL [Methylophilaceae bacterium]|nr:cell division protein FtsL [Methylophilaceae bacterium]